MCQIRSKLLHILLGRSKLLFVVLASFVVLGPLGRTVFAQGNDLWAEVSYLGSMDAISLGVFTAILAARFRFSLSSLKWLSLVGALLLIFTLGFTRTTKQLGLNALGLDMTILAVGTCLLVLAASQARWRAPLCFYPILKLGERSYEIYLTHMFVIFAFFRNHSLLRVIAKY